MGYDLHIARRGADPDERPEIPLEEWLAAVDSVESVRIVSHSAYVHENPRTGDVISIPSRKGDAEILIGSAWKPILRWFRGSAAFASGNVRIGDPADPVWAAAVALAIRLGASIRGDEGEYYDLSTGEAVTS